jgi:hypothetical protein
MANKLNQALEILDKWLPSKRGEYLELISKYAGTRVENDPVIVELGKQVNLARELLKKPSESQKQSVIVDIEQVARSVFSADQFNTQVCMENICHVVEIALRKIAIAAISTDVDVVISDEITLKVERIQ